MVVVVALGNACDAQTLRKFLFENFSPDEITQYLLAEVTVVLSDAALRELELKVEEEANHFRHLERPSERQQAYQLAEHLDAELGQTREELAECVEQLNAQRQAEAGGQEAHRLAQLVEVMDVHVNALHYLEGQSDKLDATLQQVSLLGGQQAMQRAWLHENPQQYMQQ